MHQRRGWVDSSSAYQYQGLSSMQVDHCGWQQQTDASSQASDMSTCSVGVSKHVASQLCNGSGSGQQLLQAIKELLASFEASTGAEAKSLLEKLQDVHSCIVAVDDNLDQHLSTAGAAAADLEECRQWLRQMQSYVLQLNKQVQACMADSQASEVCSTSSLDETSGSSNSSIAGTAACETTWRSICQDAADTLGRVAEQLAGGGASSSDFDSPRSERLAMGCIPGSSRLVARQARLSYAQYWSKKIAL